ncbi:unnamed protein product [Phytomonas sp. Hart1]|nr:unnamed protein product [Phytomonas sp. Hart1]|eukprot:CCW67285.1 unnamed protein product [Phytomonas sp. isolate Hart1]
MKKFDYLLIKDSDSDSSEEPIRSSPTRKEVTTGSASHAATPASISVVPVIVPTAEPSIGNPSVHEDPAFSHELDSAYRLKSHPENIKGSSPKKSVPRTTKSPLHGDHQFISNTLLNRSATPVGPAISQRRNTSSSNSKLLPKSDNIMSSPSLVEDASSISHKLNCKGNNKSELANSFQEHSNVINNNTSEHLRLASQLNTDTVESTMELKQPYHELSKRNSLMESCEVPTCEANSITPVFSTGQTLPQATSPMSKIPSSPKVYDHRHIPDHMGAETSLLIASTMNEDPVHTAGAGSGDRGEPQITFSSSGQLSYTPPPSVMRSKHKASSGCGIFSFCRRPRHAEMEDNHRSHVSTSLGDNVEACVFDPYSDLPQNTEGVLASVLDNASPYHSPAVILEDQSIHQISVSEENPNRPSAPIQDENVPSVSQRQLSSTHLFVSDKLHLTNQLNNDASNMSSKLSTSTISKIEHQQPTSYNDTVPITEANNHGDTGVHAHDAYHNMNHSINNEKGASVEKVEKPDTIQLDDTVSRKDFSRPLFLSPGGSENNSGSSGNTRGMGFQSADKTSFSAAHHGSVREAAAIYRDRGSKSKGVALFDLTPNKAARCPKMHSKLLSKGLFFYTGSPSSTKGSSKGYQVVSATKALGTSVKQTTKQMGLAAKAHYLNSSMGSTPLRNKEHQVEVAKAEHDELDEFSALPPYQRRILLDLREAERRELEEVAKKWRNLTFRPKINKYQTQVLECIEPFSERLSKPRRQKSPIPCPTSAEKVSTLNKLPGLDPQPAEDKLS